MRLDRALPLGVKLLIPSVTIVMVATGAIAFLEYQAERDYINDTYAQRGLILARAVSADLSAEEGHDHLGQSQPSHLQTHIEKVMALDPDALRASIYVRSGDGTVRAASSDPSLVGLKAGFEDAQPLYTGAATMRETSLSGDGALEILSPVTANGETVASLGVYVSLAKRDAALQALALRLTVIPALAVALAGGTVWLWLRVLVLRRLSLMIRAGEGLAQGNMASRVPGRWEKPGRDEMAKTIHEFNNMAESLQSLTAQLKHLGVTDPLTGVYNRRFLDKMLLRELSRSQRLGAPVALLMVDIDHFKRFNDRHGHQAGDQALHRVARTLARHLRTMDFVARYGGEEFAVVLPGADRRSALQTAERLRSAMESVAIGADGESERLTVSIGSAACPSDANDAVSLVTAADAALYAAKEAGRNTVRAAPAVDLAPVRD